MRSIADRISIIGDDLLSVALDEPRVAQALAEHLRSSSDWIEAVAGIKSVVVQFDNAAVDVDAAIAVLAASVATQPAPGDGSASLVEIPVCYGGDFGPDLDAVCAKLGIRPDEFIERHTAHEYRVDMLGFTPGFAYVGGLDESLNVPRRGQPRQRVAAGSVGIAGNRTGLYALPGPGGWSIVGRTPERLFDATADRPFRLRAGMRIRFRAVDHDEFG